MARLLSDWLQSYMHYTSFNESPDILHFWSGVSAIAAALRRKVWYDQLNFMWYPNFYIIFVGPSGVVAKSTTTSNAARLMHEVPGICFGPNTLTWQALVPALNEAQEYYEIAPGNHQEMSCLTFYASELGTLLDPQDRKMIDVLTDLWDGFTDSWKKATIGRGSEVVANPWLNLIAGTTPTWLSENLPKSALGGGFTSRCVFVYADKKRQLVSYVRRKMQREMDQAEYQKLRTNLVHDLEDIGMIAGEYELTENAYAFGDRWYRELNESPPKIGLTGIFDGYLSRKQGHVHKLAMVLAASRSNERMIEQRDLETAVRIMDAIEGDMGSVFHYTSRDGVGVYIDDMMQVMRIHRSLPKKALYRVLFNRTAMPSNEFEKAVQSALSAGALVEQIDGNRIVLVYNEAKEG